MGDRNSGNTGAGKDIKYIIAKFRVIFCWFCFRGHLLIIIVEGIEKLNRGDTTATADTMETGITTEILDHNYQGCHECHLFRKFPRYQILVMEETYSHLTQDFNIDQSFHLFDHLNHFYHSNHSLRMTMILMIILIVLSRQRQPRHSQLPQFRQLLLIQMINRILLNYLKKC